LKGGALLFLPYTSDDIVVFAKSWKIDLMPERSYHDAWVLRQSDKRDEDGDSKNRRQISAFARDDYPSVPRYICGYAGCCGTASEHRTTIAILDLSLMVC